VNESDEIARVGVKTVLFYCNCCDFVLLLTSLMAGPIRNFADLRLHAVTTWVQPISISFPAARGAHDDDLKVVLCADQSLPMPLFEYELHRLFKEGTASGGRKWWLRKTTSPIGTQRQAKFDLSVLFVCPHFRKEYKKQETVGNRNSQHISCVQCQAFCRFKGSVVTTDPSVCLIISGKLEHPVNDILRLLRTKFPPFNNIQSEILKLGRTFEVSFIFPSPCTAEDAVLCIQQANSELMPDVSVKVVQQERHLWHVSTLHNEHTGHVEPMLPCQRGLMLSFQMTQQVADMCASGSKPKEIIQFLSKNGQLGLITAHKVEHIRATVQSDLDTYTALFVQSQLKNIGVS
jgi:hypothetical protein